MTQDPTPYDLLQDAEISGLQEIVTPYYTEHDGSEYSFPIVGQGISAEQYRQTNLGTGNGILHRFPETYYLDTHATAAETNQHNSLILKVTRHDEPGAVAEAIINGYFHRMTEDIEIPMPPVLSPTDVYVTLTYDPREEESETGPISVQTHNGSLPTTHGREHIIIAKPRMRPNQLLSNTPLDRQRQYSSPVISVPYETTLPPAEDFLHGTIAAIGAQGRGGLYTNYSPTGDWENLLVGEWEDCTLRFNWEHHPTYGDVQARLNQGIVQMRGSMRNGSLLSGRTVIQLPEGVRPSGTRPLAAHFVGIGFPLFAYDHGGVQFSETATSTNWISFEGVSFAI